MAFRKLLRELFNSDKKSDLIITKDMLEEIEYDDLFVMIYLTAVKKVDIKFDETSAPTHLNRDAFYNNGELKLFSKDCKIDGIIIFSAMLYYLGANIHLLPSSHGNDFITGLQKYQLLDNDHNLPNSTKLIGVYLGFTDTKSARKK